jgi:cytochrome oxidase Cu insertion factor (SCO1/SenC/PrrC family)
MRALLSILSVVLVIGVVVVGAIALHRGGTANPKLAGTLLDRPVPAIPLIDPSGRKVTFASLRGKVVVLAPFLTLCHESCPLTTGAFEQIQRQVDKAGLGKRVVLVELSVDPWRDTPKRMRAFARLAGIHFTLLTGSKPHLTRLWHFFGVSFFRQPEGKPADRDWLTGKRLTFDVIHSDALFLIGKDGNERIVDSGMVTIGSLPAALVKLLSKNGHQDLTHPTPGWTVAGANRDIDSLLGTNLLSQS